jgi:hypothetical protein
MSDTFSGYDAYITYLAFKLHFSSTTYNFFTYNGKTKSNPKSYENRKDRYHFEKIAARISKESYIERMLVEYLENQNFWIKDILTADNKARHLAWRGYVEAFPYAFKSDLGKIKEYCLLNEIEYNELFKTKGVTHPLIFKMYLRKDIRLETFICVDNLIKISDKMNSPERPRDPIWSDSFLLMKCYAPFIQKFLPEREMIKKIFLEVFS